MKSKALILFSMLQLFLGQAYAALPTGFEDAVEEGKTDLQTIGGLILLVVLVIAGIRWLRRPVH